MLSEAMRAQLRDQLKTFNDLYSNFSPEVWEQKPDSGKWSARENLAHLARYHEVFLDRLQRIQQQDSPQFARYRAEDDPEWARWSPLDLPALTRRIRKLRDCVIEAVSGLSDRQLARTGIHPALGELTVPQWIEFFLLHEAHHLYKTLFLLRTES